MASAIESILVFSDVHLASDLNDAGKSVPRSTAIDADLAALLAHYRELSSPAGHWHLVIAGDFVDFVGMSIDLREGDSVTTALTPCEKRFGLGGAEDHVRLKLRRAAARHPDVFGELRRFMEAGNKLTIVLGNHDLEMHWASVQKDFCELVGASRDAVKFESWFYHREGFVFVEHGHQYDPFCSTPFILSPLSPRDRHRIAPSLSDTLLRRIVRRTPGMKEYGHETRGLMSYVSWGLMLGARGTAALFLRFVSTVSHLWGTAKAYASAEGKHVADEHERALEGLSTRLGISRARLDEARALHTTTLGATPRGVLASVMLDRLFTFCVMIPLLATIAWKWTSLGPRAPFVLGAALVLWAVLHVLFSRGRPNVDPGALMVERSTKLASLFPSSFIVMGHTHVPTTKAVGDAIYINVGSWAEEEPEPNETKPYRAARTHLVMHAYPDRHEARLCEWRSGVGPHPLTELIKPLRATAPEGAEAIAV